MDINMTLLVLILVILVVTLIVVVNTLKKYKDNTNAAIQKKIKEFEEVVSNSIDNIENKTEHYNTKLSDFFYSHSKKIDAKLKENYKELKGKAEEQEVFFKDTLTKIKNDYNSLKETQTKTIEKLSEDLRKTHQKNITEIEYLNKKLVDKLDTIRENNQKIEKITLALEKNQQKLEEISDAIKQMISEHELRISQHLQSFEDAMNETSSGHKDTLKELASSSETMLNRIIDDTNKQIKEALDSNQKNFAQITLDTKYELEELAKSIKERINHELKTTDIENVNLLINDFISKLDSTVEANKSSMEKIKSHIEEKTNAMDEKLEKMSKKRKFL
jgi:DNA repair exonuclease SbcCD ATPase subunit